MVKKERVLADISTFQGKYRHPELGNKYDISPEYCLTPDNPNVNNKGKVVYEWPGEYPPQFGKPGVYLVFSEERLLTYVGKASLSSTISGRLGAYFSYEKDRVTCKIKHKWVNEPKFVIAVAMPEGHAFEAPALEEYLITRYRTELPDNMSGTGKKRTLKPKADDAQTTPV